MDFIHFILYPFSQVIGRIRKTSRQNSILKAQPRLRLQQNPKCWINQLPCELILSVCDQLDPQSQVLLSETCRFMWAVLGNDSLEIIAEFKMYEHVEFQSILVRDYPDWWFCDRCMSLHRVMLSDNYDLVHSKLKDYYDQDAILTRVKHRHVQLALKYTRMQGYCRPFHQECLQRLLAPYHFSQTAYGPIDIGRQSVQCSCYPKVALGQDGRLRYLLLAVVRLPPSSGRVDVAEPMAYFDICPHLAVNYRHGDFREAVEQRNLEPFLIPFPHVAIAIQAALEKSKRDGLCGDINESEEVCDGCPRCPLDFSVRVARDFIELRLWQDFGPEVAKSDVAWQVHICGRYWYEGCVYSIVWGEGPNISHVPGSIRRLYEGGVEDEELEN